MKFIKGVYNVEVSETSKIIIFDQGCKSRSHKKFTVRCYSLSFIIYSLQMCIVDDKSLCMVLP